MLSPTIVLKLDVVSMRNRDTFCTSGMLIPRKQIIMRYVAGHDYGTFNTQVIRLRPDKELGFTMVARAVFFIPDSTD